VFFFYFYNLFVFIYKSYQIIIFRLQSIIINHCLLMDLNFNWYHSWFITSWTLD